MTKFINLHTLESLGLILLIAFVLTSYIIPKIIKVVNYKELMDLPNQRSSHEELTPTFGGISFFLILIFTLVLIQDFDEDNISLNIIAGLTILLFTGLKDDLVVISLRSKLLGQLLSVGIFLFNTDFYITNLQGFLGFYEIEMYFGIALTTIIILSIINVFNLIDGIDGLAASIGVITITIYVVIYYITNEYFFTLIGISLIGSLMAFLRFNLSSSKKIFMGDTGSLIIGFIVAILTVKFLTLDTNNLNRLTFIPNNSMFVVASILIFPIFDTMRVLIVRLIKKKNLLLSDKNHTHHMLLKLGNSHIKASFLISIISLILSISFIYLTTIINNTWIIAGVYVFTFSLFFGIFFKSSFQETN